jgi:lysophospholipase L1-like esterase
MRIVAAALLVICGIGTTACDKLGLGDDDDPTSPTNPTPSAPVRYTPVGASDVVGIGSTAPCLAIFGDCPTGKGYPFVAAAQLRSQGHTVSVYHLGFPTATISRRFMDLGTRYGHVVVANFMDSAVPFVPRDSTVVTIFAGGNEVNVITAALGAGGGGASPAAFIDQQVLNFAADYMTVVSAIRERISSSGRIIALNLPNLSRMPYVATAPLAQRQAVHRASLGMTTSAINPLASQGVRVVDLMCLAALYQPASLSSDGFHPSDAGYALIAAEVVRAITATTFAAPLGSCPQMSM